MFIIKRQDSNESVAESPTWRDAANYCREKGYIQPIFNPSMVYGLVENANRKMIYLESWIHSDGSKVNIYELRN